MNSMTRVDTSAGYLSIQLRLKILQGTLYCSYDHWWTEQGLMTVFLTKSLVSVLSIKHKITKIIFKLNSDFHAFAA
jgi:hypothetical protein